MHNVRMNDRLITMAALVAALVLALGTAGFFVVRFRSARRDVRNTQRDRDGAVAQVRAERQRADEAERRAAGWKQHATVATDRLVAFQEHVDEIVQGTRHKAPRKLWSVKGFGWLTGTVTGAWAASRTFASSVTSNAAASSAAVSTGSAVAGGIGQSFALASAAVLVAGAGVLAVYTQPATSATQPQPPAARGLPNPPAAKRPLAAPPSVRDTLSTTETPTVAPTVTSTPTPTTTSTRSATPTTRAEPTTAPSTTPTTTVAASTDPAPPVTVTSAAPAGAAPEPASDVAPRPAVDHTTKVHPVPDTEETRSAGKAAKSAQPVQFNRTCITLEPLLPVTTCVG